MEKLLNLLNRIETPLLIFWLIAIGVWEGLHLNIAILVVVIAVLLAILYLLQGNKAGSIIKNDNSIVKAFPVFFGTSSSVLVLGILFRLMHWPGGIMSNIGMAGILLSCLFLFYNPVQDEFLPVLKKLLLRIFILICLGLLSSF